MATAIRDAVRAYCGSRGYAAESGAAYRGTPATIVVKFDGYGTSASGFTVPPSHCRGGSSAQNSIMSDCEQNNGEPASYCQCDLSWLEANIPYSMFVQAPATFEQQADAYASC